MLPFIDDLGHDTDGPLLVTDLWVIEADKATLRKSHHIQSSHSHDLALSNDNRVTCGKSPTQMD